MNATIDHNMQTEKQTGLSQRRRKKPFRRISHITGLLNDARLNLCIYSSTATPFYNHLSIFSHFKPSILMQRL
jgi:hypothetical protein